MTDKQTKLVEDNMDLVYFLIHRYLKRIVLHGNMVLYMKMSIMCSENLNIIQSKILDLL